MKGKQKTVVKGLINACKILTNNQLGNPQQAQNGRKNINTGAPWPGAGGLWPSQFSRNRRIFGNFNAPLENLWAFAVSKDRCFEFYRKIIEIVPPTLQVPRRPYIDHKKESDQ